MRNKVMRVVVPQGRNRKPAEVLIVIKAKRAEAIKKILVQKYGLAIN